MFGKGHDFNGKKVSPMQVAILVLLRPRPMYGYEVLTALREHFEGVWTPQTGSIYPALRRLEEHGLVASERRDDTDYYSITEVGGQWVLGVLTRSPRDVRLMARYFELLGTASADIIRLDGNVPGPFSQMFEDDSEDRDVKAAKLRAARERLMVFLAQIEKELEELENEGGKE